MIPTTRIEKNFLIRPDGLYQEVFNHYIVYRQPGTNAQTSILDKTIRGGVYREGALSERSVNGEEDWVDQNGIRHHLIGLRMAQPI